MVIYFPSHSVLNCSGASLKCNLCPFTQSSAFLEPGQLAQRFSSTPHPYRCVSSVPGVLQLVLPNAAISDLCARYSGPSPPAARRSPSLIRRPVLSIFTQACVDTHTLSRPSRADSHRVLFQEILCPLKVQLPPDSEPCWMLYACSGLHESRVLATADPEETFMLRMAGSRVAL